MNAAAGPERGLRAVAGTVLCVAATWASLLALGGLVEGSRWYTVACTAVLVVATSTALARAVSRTWWLPTLVGGLVAAVGLVLRYGSPPGRPQFVPDLDAVARAWDVAREGVRVVNDSYVPMPDVRPGEMLLVLGAVGVVLLVDAAVLAVRVPALAGVALLALWVPAVLLGFPAGALPLALTGLAYLALLAFGAAPQHARAGRTRRAGAAAGAGAALVALALVAGPPLMSVPGWASMALPRFGEGPVGPLELSSELDLRDSLGQRSSQVVLRYTVTASEDEAAGTADEGSVSLSTPASGDPVANARLVGPLRAFTLTTFDGRTWERTETDDLAGWDPAGLLASDPALRGLPPDPAAGTLATVEVQVGALSEQRLPVTTFPRTLDAAEDWQYDAVRDEVVSDDPTRDGERYSMVVQVPDLTADQLRAAVPGSPPQAELYTAVPATTNADDVARTAREVTAEATTPYEQALALQTWFRSATNFVYDTRVPPARSQDAVWDFLQTRRGYCVQFSTAMTMMARSLDIPARVAVGFLPGEADDEGGYVVTGRLAHAWPELYFDGLGWVRFEPTPASQTGPPPVWANPFTGATAPASVPDEVDRDQAAPVPSASSTAPVAGGPSGSGEDVSWLVVALGTGVGLVLLAAAAGTGVLIARRARVQSYLTPERAWATLRRRLARRGITWSDATTARTAALRLEDEIGRRASDVTAADAARAALASLLAAVESQRYAPHGPARGAHGVASPGTGQRSATRETSQAGGTDELAGWVETIRLACSRPVSDRPRADAGPSAPPAGP
ncbi:DUF3488 and transglutaminase-like domain-containing protein [Cellulomonas sp. SLBN-39]|uniref:DUF3488 and transglutaminase-like domain-containing protein n=1 Tax=Cellulomonas sp. SLBN-39 TaxID=2768446 RepID=UPI0011523735|nr:DUF3488 and transglutaminase-like domain-containing protein [Cellulomonas sp. SLBN-39]TQL04456.1 transglutaminase superfamily protein [Cellulomonas sp. SLBN-39]